MANLEGKYLGRYQVLEQIGLRGMVTAYRVYDPTLDRHLAVRVLETQYLARHVVNVGCFYHWAKRVAQLQHPNIFSVLDIGNDGKILYLVTTYMPGADLQALLGERGGPLPLKNTAEVAIQALDGLHYIHSQGIIHRDIKPSNIFLADDGTVLLDDVGLADIWDECLAETGVQTLAVMGTPTYMSPEQVMAVEIDHRSDLYAFGVVLYQMATGKVPFAPALTPLAAMHQHVTEPPPWPLSLNPELPEEFGRILLKALNKSPDDRYQSAEEMARAIRSVLARSGPSVASIERARLYAVLVERFDLEELRSLCFKLGVDYDSLRGEGKAARVRELIAHLERRSDIGRLTEEIRRERGGVI